MLRTPRLFPLRRCNIAARCPGVPAWDVPVARPTQAPRQHRPVGPAGWPGSYHLGREEPADRIRKKGARGLQAVISAPACSTGRLTLTGRRGLLDRVQHPMARDRVVERGAEMCSVAIVAGETRIRLGNVGGRAVQRRQSVLLRHGQDLERGLRALAATYGHLEDLRLAAVSRHL